MLDTSFLKTFKPTKTTMMVDFVGSINFPRRSPASGNHRGGIADLRSQVHMTHEFSRSRSSGSYGYGSCCCATTVAGATPRFPRPFLASWSVKKLCFVLVLLLVSPSSIHSLMRAVMTTTTTSRHVLRFGAAPAWRGGRSSARSFGTVSVPRRRLFLLLPTSSSFSAPPSQSRLSPSSSFAFFTTSVPSSFTALFATSVDDDENNEAENEHEGLDPVNVKSIDEPWDVGMLKRETLRLVHRCHKKLGKAHEKVRNAEAHVSKLTNNPDVTLEELESCPDVDAFQLELSLLQERLRGLNELETALQPLKNKLMVLPSHIAQLALQWGVRDQPPMKPPRGPGKAKGPRERPTSRLPYRRYYSKNGVEIRVGKRASDNDQLTLNPLHRDGTDWWMHASGCPGSHVVIRCPDEVLDAEVKLDAAALAARHSKCATSVIKVSLTRARDIRKPPGAKDGLVQLMGRVETVVVDMKAAQERLTRLDATEVVN